MGWWSFPEDPSIIVGDEPMDATYDYLERLAELYEEENGRKPTLAELQALLRLALRIAGERAIADLEDRQVQSVTIKTGPRPKKQKYQVGDIFAVPLPRDRWVFGRILNLGEGWDLVEIFAHVSGTPRYTSAVAESGRLFPPIWIDPVELFEEWRWKILQSDPGYEAPDLGELKYVMGMPGMYKWIKVNDFRPGGPLTDKEAEKLPHRVMLPEEAAVNEIEKALRGRKAR